VEFSGKVIIDASGAGGFLARTLPIAPGPALRTRSSLLYGHFEGVEALADVVQLSDDDAPYPEDRAAVHHLLDEGWLYSLRFDSGLVSAGLLVEDEAQAERWGAQPVEGFAQAIGRYPSLAASFVEARAVRPVHFRRSIQYRLGATHGPRWTVLPNTYGFVDPLFSTGIAWSLLGVERLAEVLLDRSPGDAELASGAALTRYGQLLELELDQADRLISAAYRARSNTSLFAAHSLLYFALVSFEEATQRLCVPEAPCWRSFLGAADPARVALLDEAARRIDSESSDPGEFETWVRGEIEPFDVAGLGNPSRRNLYPADFETLVERAPRLGLSAAEVRAALPRLRGMESGL
jgi:FADH2 O2-dependent halogenase